MKEKRAGRRATEREGDGVTLFETIPEGESTLRFLSFLGLRIPSVPNLVYGDFVTCH